MPLPIAHGLLGATVVAALRPSSEPRTVKLLLTGALLAISPDFDYVLNWLKIDYGGCLVEFLIFAQMLFVVLWIRSDQRSSAKTCG